MTSSSERSLSFIGLISRSKLKPCALNILTFILAVFFKGILFRLVNYRISSDSNCIASITRHTLLISKEIEKKGWYGTCTCRRRCSTRPPSPGLAPAYATPPPPRDLPRRSRHGQARVRRVMHASDVARHLLCGSVAGGGGLL